MTHICSFSGSVSYLTRKEKKNPMRVLKCLSEDPMVSTWDMGEHKLYETVYDLEKRGLIAEVKKPFPWHRFEITEAGKAALLEWSGE